MVDKIKKYLSFEKSIYIVFCIYIVAALLTESSIAVLEETFRTVIKIIRYICYFFFFIKIIYDWKNDKSKITIPMIIITIVSIIVYFFSKSKSILILILILFALRNTDREKLIRIALKTYIIIFFTIIIGALLNFIPDLIYPTSKLVRHTIGFSYPTVTAGLYLMLVMMYVYNRKSKITIYEIITMELINVFLYKYTYGKTSFILVTVILLIMTLQKVKFVYKFFNSKFSKKILKVCCYIMPTVLLIIILVVTLLYGFNNSMANKLSIILSNRIELGYNAFKEYDVTLFGQKTQWNGWGGFGYNKDIDVNNFVYNYVDNSYVRVIINYGIIMTAIVIGSYTIILIQSYNKKDYWLVFEIFIILILAEIEPCLINFNSNIFLIFLIPLLEYKPIEKFSYQNIRKIICKNKNKNGE